MIEWLLLGASITLNVIFYRRYHGGLQMNEEELEALKHENSLLRDAVRQSEPDREAKEHYERTLQEIGRLIGCDRSYW